MKKTILALTFITLFSFIPSDKTYKVELSLSDWVVYTRNIERLQDMAGRTVPSDILLATKDTVSQYQKYFVFNIQKQLTDTTRKK